MGVMEARRRILLNQPHLVSATGNPIAFSTNFPANLDECKMNFAPVQAGSGDPSPSNVRPITGWTGCNVWRTGKNLLDTENTELGTYDQTTGEPTSGTSNQRRTKYAISVTPGTKITYSTNNDGNGRMFFYGSDGAYISTSLATNGTANTVPNNARFMKFASNAGGFPSDKQFQIEYGEASDYVAYSGSSYPVTFPAAGKNLLNLNRTEGEPVQKDTSNLTSPREMDTEHYFRGTRFDNYYYKSYCNATISNGTITVESFTNNNYGVGFPVAVEGGEKYTLSLTAEHKLISIAYYDSEWHYLSGSQGIYSTPNTETVPNNAAYAVIVFRSALGSTYTYSDIQFEKGETATTYEPFTNTLYGGYVDLANGEVVAEYGFRDMGKLTWSYNQDREQFYTTSPSDAFSVRYLGDTKPFLCSVYKGVTIPENDNEITMNSRATGSSNVIRVVDSSYSGDAAAFKTGVTGQKLVYRLETPIHYPITPAIIKSIKGANTIWSDTNGNVDIKYWKH